ncbi:MAG: DUF2796 domain-containing protein [Chromatiales bacterium]|nr:DUF2796 domain-containing protein [Chromatiales bacterium]
MLQFKHLLLPLVGLTSIAFANATLAASHEEHRQHASHVHGEAHLDLIQDGPNLHIEITSPAANIMGFEHPPANEDDHRTLKQALHRLEDGKQMFRFSEAANCNLDEAKVTSPWAEHEEEHDGEHKEEHHEEHAHKHDEQSEHKEKKHADITAAYHFVCTNTEALQQMTVMIFKEFPATHELHVQFVTSKGQGGIELTSAQPTLSF